MPGGRIDYHLCMMSRGELPLILLLVAWAAGCSTAPPAVQEPQPEIRGVRITELDGHLRVEMDGDVFAEYYYRDVPKPFLYPIFGPGQVPLTRSYPMVQVPGEEESHPHHRSLWFTHGSVNGHDFWLEQPASGRIVHEKLIQIRPGRESGLVVTSNRWVTSRGAVLCTDTRSMSFHAISDTIRALDMEVTIHASEGDLVFGDSKEGSMAVRVAETMRVRRPTSEGPASRTLERGSILNSAGARDSEAWGKRAAWCAYYGPVEGRQMGIAVFDHPSNPRHPTWWHVRDYGLLAANPFGTHDFEKLSDAHAGDLSVPEGESVTFRYRFLFFAGDPDQVDLGVLYAEYEAKADSGT